MELNIDSMLLFLAGMIFGGFLYVKTESFILKKHYPSAEGDDRIKILKKIGFGLTFIGVFLFVLTFFLVKSVVLAGVFAGFAIFGIKP